MNNSWTFKDWVHGFWGWDGDIEMLFYIIKSVRKASYVHVICENNTSI